MVLNTRWTRLPKFYNMKSSTNKFTSKYMFVVTIYLMLGELETKHN